MVASTEALRKERDKEVATDGGGLLFPSASQHLSGTQHSFPEFPSQKTLQTIVTMEWETAYPHKSSGISGLQGHKVKPLLEMTAVSCSLVLFLVLFIFSSMKSSSLFLTYKMPFTFMA